MFNRALTRFSSTSRVRFSARSLATMNNCIPMAVGSLIEVSGVDTYKFLQGLCTNDVMQLKHTRTTAAAFLTIKGRIFANTILYEMSTPGDVAPRVVLEVDCVPSDEFLRYLTMYKLRSKVVIKPLNWRSYLVPDDHIAGASNLECTGEPLVHVKDPRIPDFGTRMLIQDATVSASNDASLASDWYDRYKLVHGIADGAEVRNRIPLECNLDLLHYISFAKGCYVGQELTARTKFKGLVRKRLVPFLLAQSADVSATGNRSSFGPLTPDLRSSLISYEYSPKKNVDKNGVLGVGSRVYADAHSAKSVGEVVHIDRTGTIGVAMVQQAAMAAHTGNFIVRAPVSKSGAEDESGAVEEVHEEVNVLDSVVGYISTFRPDWFQGLDAKTGNVADL